MATENTRADVFAERHSSHQMRQYSTYRTGLGELETNIARVVGAPPGYYEHPAYDGISVYMALSRNVGRVDVGDGVFDMAAQAKDFVVGIPGSTGKMESFRGGHGMQVVISPKALQASAGGTPTSNWDYSRLHSGFHNNKSVSSLMEEISAVALSDNRSDTLHLDSLVLLLIDELERFSSTVHRRQNEVQALDETVVARVVDYIDAHLSAPVTLEDLAELSGLTATRFLKAFRNSVGETPYQHLLRRRLESARLLLMKEHETISEIALICGFSSQQHMTGLFSERFGISPAAFRRQVRLGEVVENRELHIR